jgi:hypothetical protein
MEMHSCTDTAERFPSSSRRLQVWGETDTAGPSVGGLWCDAVTLSRSCLAGPSISGIIDFSARWHSREGEKERRMDDMSCV